jgi:hypothetical protein
VHNSERRLLCAQARNENKYRRFWRKRGARVFFVFTLFSLFSLDNFKQFRTCCNSIYYTLGLDNQFRVTIK